MIPMLGMDCQTAPQQPKVTYFAVMASFTNLALSLSSLGTKYLNADLHCIPSGIDAATGA